MPTNSYQTTGKRMRLRELGFTIGKFTTGRWNAITDVPGVLVGHSTIIDEVTTEKNAQIIRTGVSIILPRGHQIAEEPVFAGTHTLNGNGEMTGLEWVRESGTLTTPIALTNTHSVGVVRDAIIDYAIKRRCLGKFTTSLPVVGETWDGELSDINGMHVTKEHVFQAITSARNGHVTEGSVGGGTGMICHDFKAGIGTASRIVTQHQWVVGVLVQANYGKRERFCVNGVPMGKLIPIAEVPSPRIEREKDTGSIIIIVATNAPMIPTQCSRIAQRAALGVARVGGIGGNGSGDVFLAFSTANSSLTKYNNDNGTISINMLPNDDLDDLFEATIDATEEAIINSICMANTMNGVNGKVAYAIPLDRLYKEMTRFTIPY